MKKLFTFGALALASLAHAQTPPAFGSYLKMFSADSLWNSRPVNPVFGTYQIPDTTFNPTVASGAWSTGIFQAQDTNKEMIVYPRGTNTGVWDPDGEKMLATVRIPHWPANTQGATGADGHADIVDSTENKVYSFSQLSMDASGKWSAQQIAWSPLNGTGWGDPAHYFQGARAAGVPTSAGMIRVDEVNDGKALFEHALAMSLDYTALTPAPNQFIYPATSGDATDPQKANSGQIAEGTRMMLPASFDLKPITDLRLLKVATTLKTYGAYVVDRNYNTPFVIYVENGATWGSLPADQLQKIQHALRPVVSQDGHINGNGVARVPESEVNLLSMRGTWAPNYVANKNDKLGVYDTFQQALTWDTTAGFMSQTNFSMRDVNVVKGAGPNAPKRYKLSVAATGGASLQMTIWVAGANRKTTAVLSNAGSEIIAWPDGATISMLAQKPAGGKATLSARLVELPPGQ
ncbi:Atrophin-1 multi-domain protein [Janthinobacterium sp.]|uniref:Atrophin-1 multi-domain protein n=1 Tax=Janthinobacterium sp. TaxID=1871054 RepID=UPI00293D992B|nr:Atrophin-1 multi-domain protein [Janthinobacterium sp.]